MQLLLRRQNPLPRLQVESHHHPFACGSHGAFLAEQGADATNMQKNAAAREIRDGHAPRCERKGSDLACTLQLLLGKRLLVFHVFLRVAA